MKKLDFYKLAVEIAASKTLTHSEKLIAAYLHTFFDNNRPFYGSNAHISEKLNIKKSSISVCLKKLSDMGWIAIDNSRSNKRKITELNNPSISKEFYRLYSVVAESKYLTSLEKILLSYILSFTDNGKRFYAKNAQVKHILDISKEGFNTSRIRFEELEWIKVKYPKSPRRELIIINHPLENMPTEIRSTRKNAGVTDIKPANILENDRTLPENNNILPVNNDNYISNKRSNEKKEIIEDIIEPKMVIDNTSNSYSDISFDINKVKEILPNDGIKNTTPTIDVLDNKENTIPINGIKNTTPTNGSLNITNNSIPSNPVKNTTPTGIKNTTPTKDEVSSSETTINTKEDIAPDLISGGPSLKDGRRISIDEDPLVLEYEDELGRSYKKNKPIYFNPIKYMGKENYEILKKRLFIDPAIQARRTPQDEESIRESFMGFDKVFIDEILVMLEKERKQK